MWEPKRPRVSSEGGGTPRVSSSADDDKVKLEESSSQAPEADTNMGGTSSQTRAKGDQDKLEGVSSPVPELEVNDDDSDDEVVGCRSTTEIGINPMLNPVILDGLLGVCQLKDLRRFRLVCKLWLEVSLKRWRSEMIVSIIEPLGFGRYRSHLNYNNTSLLYDDPDMKAKPFRRFRLEQYYRFPVTEFCPRSSFLKICGPWIHHLEIIEPRISRACVALFYKFIFEQAPNLKSLKLLDTPNYIFFEGGKETPKKPHLSLESLTFTLVRVHSNNEEEGHDCIPFHQLFKYFPNIKNLTLESHIHREYEALPDALEDLQNKGVEGRKLNIIYKRMRNFGIDPEAIFYKNFIKLPHVSLSSLDVALDSVLEANFLSDVFKFHHNTLTTLNMSRGQEGDIPNPPDNPFQSTHPFLTKLHLKGNVVENFCFLEYTPNLTQLHFTEIHLRNTLNKTNLRNMESKIRLGNLKMLKILPIQSFKSQDLFEAEMKTIVTCMPNVKQFVGPLTNESFRVVCENWKELKALEITYSDNPVDDSGITGMGVRLEGEEAGSRMPNLTDLKYLYEFGTRSLLLSDNSIWNGILKLEYLHALEVKFAAKTTNEAFSVAFAKFPSVSVTRALSMLKGERQLNYELGRKALELQKDFGIQ